MADGVTFQTSTLATPASGTEVATDDCGAAGHAQIVKLGVSADGDATALTATAVDGLLVNLGSNNDVTVTSGTVTVGAALPAGTNNIGDVDVASVPAPLSTTGNGTAAAALRVTVASDSTGTVAVTHGALTELAAAIDTEVQVDVVGALPAGTNAIGKLAANSGVDIGDVDVTSVTPGTGATNLGKVEDAAHTTGDVGVMALAVRNDAGTALAGTTGDYIPLSTDANGALRVTGGGGGTEYTEGDTDATIVGGAILWEDAADTLRPVSAAKPLPVAIISGAGSGGTAMTDDAAFTPGTTSVTPIAGTFDDTTPDSVDEGDGGAVRMSANRNLYVRIRDNAGNERGLNVDANGAIAATVTNATAANLNMTEANSAAIAASLSVLDDWDETNRCAVNPISGQVGVAGGSGTVGATTQRVVLATDVALPTGTNTVGRVMHATSTTGGCSMFKSIDLDESEEEVKGSAGTLYWVHVMNLTASKLYFKVYNNTAAGTTVGTTVPDLTFPIGTMGDTNGVGFTINFGPAGIALGTGITFACTTGLADNDTGAPAANACVVNAGYA